MEQNCENCRFFEDFKDADYKNTGYCRRYPPSAPVMEDGEWQWLWAEVVNAPYNWCGEFAPSNAPSSPAAKQSGARKG